MTLTDEAASYAMDRAKTPEQRARLIAGGPNAGRVKRWTGCHECAWGKVAGCWRCGSR